MTTRLTVGRYLRVGLALACAFLVNLSVLRRDAHGQDAPAGTANGQGVTTMAVDVKVVTLPVTVRDKKGQIVRNLTKDDFVLQEDGRPQVIKYFTQDTNLPLTLGLLVGSDRYTGAALLATGGAIRGGAGMVRLVTFPAAAAAVRQLHPEVIITELAGETSPRSGSPEFDLPDSGSRFPQDVGRVQAWVAGPGMGTDEHAAARLAGVLATDLPVLVDADGLTILSQVGGLPRQAPTLITPHAGELARLLRTDAASVEARRLEHARRAAAELGATVLLKGSTTVIAQPHEEPVLVNPTGTPWLATAGTGDVLSGLAGSLLAQGLAPAEAALAAAYLHGLAARLAAAGPGPDSGEAPIAAFDVVRSLPDAFRSL